MKIYPLISFISKIAETTQIPTTDLQSMSDPERSPNIGGQSLASRLTSFQSVVNPYVLQRLGCHGRIVTDAPQWPELKGVIDDSVQACRERYAPEGSVATIGVSRSE